MKSTFWMTAEETEKELRNRQLPSQFDYEEDVRRRPTYHDGSPRKTWDQLGILEQWSWRQKPR